MRESAVERYLVDRVAALGGEVRKVRWIGRHGAPDRLVMLPSGKIMWVETKASGKKARPSQIREHERMRRMGQRVEVVDSPERVDEVLA
ncbi:hypothetical protein COW64_24160 [bacterium (Candidatus Blackallbacteria) CG18_big_fil_WC_8_21_14_2_50_49_26]|nr:MAG: hypothetical protein COW64_24160 [bacterium (Candidatus Blackallbacteria) CG18_big_fil_WC_8_21_14_2_50_49_26]